MTQRGGMRGKCCRRCCVGAAAHDNKDDDDDDDDWVAPRAAANANAWGKCAMSGATCLWAAADDDAAGARAAVAMAMAVDACV